MRFGPHILNSLNNLQCYIFSDTKFSKTEYEFCLCNQDYTGRRLFSISYMPMYRFPFVLSILMYK